MADVFFKSSESYLFLKIELSWQIDHFLEKLELVSKERFTPSLVVHKQVGDGSINLRPSQLVNFMIKFI